MVSDRQRASASAFIAGMSTLILFPLDKIKLNMMISDGFSSNFVNYYKNSKETFRFLYGQGLRGLYRGCHLNIVFSMAWSVYFYVYEGLKVFQHLSPEDSEWKKFAIASEAAMVCNLVVNPLIVIRTRALLTQTSENWLRDTKEACIKTFQVDGIRGFWNGYLPGLILGFNGSCTVYLYEKFRDVFGSSFFGASAAGASSKIIASTLFYPLALVKTKLQQEQYVDTIQRHSHSIHNFDKNKVFYGFLDCIKRTYSNAGASGFYRGLGIALIKVVPTQALFFATYEVCLRVFK